MSSATATPLGLAITPRPTPDALRRLREQSRHRARRIIGDTLATLVAAAASGTVLSAGFRHGLAEVVVSSGILALVFLLSLSVARTREPGIAGSRELRRLALAAALTFAAGACWVAFAPTGTSRAALLATVPAFLICTAAARWHERRFTPVARRRHAPRTLVVGPRAVVDTLLTTLAHDTRIGYDVVGATLADADDVDGACGGVPVLGAAAATAAVAREVHADTVVVAGAASDPDFVRRLSWQLEGTGTELVLATALTDVAAGRISLRTTTGLALVGVRVPTYSGATHRVKRVLDVAVAAVALVPIVLAAPFIAAAIRLDSPGPVLFRQRRVGRDGRTFDILKFRTMRLGAETEVAHLAGADEGAGVLFKVRRDPRVTRVGRVLRKYSIDELPQFWNVLRGEMSVVGPRPPLPREVEAYDDPVFRRLYLRPGITGPWQIGGRSDLTWEASVRLDLHYVENWSVVSDLAIILRTAGVVLRAKGAY